MQRFKLTSTAKILILLVVVGLVGGGIFALFQNGIIKDPVSTVTKSLKAATPVGKSAGNTINLSLDEWIGWKPIIDANGGITTKAGSIFDKLGIKVNINIINDATQSSNALIKGDLNAAGYTINRTAFLSQKFKDNKVNVVMPIITNFSNGGDGIIANSKYKTVESLVGAKIGVPRFSEAHSLVIWFVNKSDLSQPEKDTIINNLIIFETPDEAAKAFFAGKIDVAATWQPYLSQAQDSTDSHVLFSTASSKKLIMDGVLFREDFAKANPELVSKFIDGVFQAESLYNTEFKYIKEVMPMFNDSSEDSIKGMTGDAGLANWKSNKTILASDAVQIYNDMCSIWQTVKAEDGSNIKVNNDLVSTLFNASYLEALSGKYASSTAPSTNKVITQEQKNNVVNTQALMTKTATINFLSDSAKFVDNAAATEVLDKFIEIAKTLDGTIIQIEGNINGVTATEAGKKLSEERAKTVAKYFQMNGVDPNRFIIIGNGNSKMIGNDSEEGKAKNRRTDIFFKTVEE